MGYHIDMLHLSTLHIRVVYISMAISTVYKQTEKQ